MPIGWIEKLQNEKAKKWAYDYLVKKDVLWAADRGKNGYQCVVAEIPLNDDDCARFDLRTGVTILMVPKDRARAIGNYVPEIDSRTGKAFEALVLAGWSEEDWEGRLLLSSKPSVPSSSSTPWTSSTIVRRAILSPQRL